MISLKTVTTLKQNERVGQLKTKLHYSLIIQRVRYLDESH